MTQSIVGPSQPSVQAIPLLKRSITLNQLSALSSSISLSQQLSQLKHKMHLRFPVSLSITEENYRHIENFLRISLELYFLIRLDSLIAEPYMAMLSKSQQQLKEEYLVIYFGYGASRDVALSYMLVIVAHAVMECVQQWLPELEITERMRMDIFHIMVTTTLGIFIGDAAIRGLVAKFTGARQEKKEPKEVPKQTKRSTIGFIQAKSAGSEEADQFITEVRKMLKVEPATLPPIVAKSLDYQYDDQLKENISIDRQQLERRLKKFKIYSNQVSSALAEVKGKDKSVLPFIKPSKLPFSLECASMHFQRKPLFRKVEQPEIPPDPPKKERVNKKDISYWKRELHGLREYQGPNIKAYQAKQLEDEESIQKNLNNLCKALKGQSDAQLLLQANQNLIFVKDFGKPKQSQLMPRISPLPPDSPKKNKTIKIEGDHYKVGVAGNQLISLNAPEAPMKQEEKPIQQQRSNRRKIKQLKKAKIQFEKQCMSDKIRCNTDDTIDYEN